MWLVEKPRKDKLGKRWLFACWHEDQKVATAEHPQQLLFWNEERTESGVVLFPRDKTVRHSLIKAWIEKLVADPELRKQYDAPLRFPVQRYYMKNGFHPEETTS